MTRNPETSPRFPSLWPEASGGEMPRRMWLVLLFVAFAMLVPGTGIMPLLDRDEPRFSHATMEMEARGDWVVPYFNGQYRFDKPPLTYWLMEADYTVFGHGETGARMHSVFAAGIVACILLALGREMFGWRTGFWAAFSWLTLLQVWEHGRLAVADMPMVAAVTAGHWALWKLLSGEKRRSFGLWFWVLWGSVSLGFLAKGPIALLCPLLTLLFYRFVFLRKPVEWARLQILPGALLALVPIAAWGLPALYATHGEFWHQGMGRHVIDRGLGAFDDRTTIPVLFYVGTALVSLFPWLGRVGSAWEALRTARVDARAAFLASWLVGPYLIFAFYATQLPHYVLPAFPALCLLFFAAPEGAKRRWARRWFFIYHGFFLAIILFLALWLLFGPVHAPVRPMMLGMVGVLMGLEFVAVNFEARKGIRLGFGLAMVILGGVLAAHGMRQVALSPQIAPFARGAKGTFACVGYTEPSLVYYTDACWDSFPATPTGVEAAIASKPAVLVVLRHQANTTQMLGFSGKAPRDTLYAATAERLVAAGYVQSRVEGLNIARFSWAAVDIYRSADSFGAAPAAK